MGLGISRSVPSSPGERSPSDKFNPHSASASVTVAETFDTCSPSGHVSPTEVRYHNKVSMTSYILVKCHTEADTTMCEPSIHFQEYAFLPFLSQTELIWL